MTKLGRFLPVRCRQLRPIAATASLQPVARRSASLIRSCQPAILLKMRNQIAVELDRHQFFRDGNVTFSLHADRLGRCRRRWLNIASATDKASVGRYRFGGLVMRISPVECLSLKFAQTGALPAPKWRRCEQFHFSQLYRRAAAADTIDVATLIDEMAGCLDRASGSEPLRCGPIRPSDIGHAKSYAARLSDARPD